jgi:hypothetical protein
MNTRLFPRFAAATVLAVLPAVSAALDFEITPAVQAELDRQKAAIAVWAADPIVVKAVQEQNKKGPIAGMDKAKWKSTRRSDPLVKEFQTNPAGAFLHSRMRASVCGENLELYPRRGREARRSVYDGQALAGQA